MNSIRFDHTTFTPFLYLSHWQVLDCLCACCDGNRSGCRAKLFICIQRRRAICPYSTYVRANETSPPNPVATMHMHRSTIVKTHQRVSGQCSFWMKSEDRHHLHYFIWRNHLTGLETKAGINRVDDLWQRFRTVISYCEVGLQLRTLVVKWVWEKPLRIDSTQLFIRLEPDAIFPHWKFHRSI